MSSSQLLTMPMPVVKGDGIYHVFKDDECSEGSQESQLPARYPFLGSPAISSIRDIAVDKLREFFLSRSHDDDGR